LEPVEVVQGQSRPRSPFSVLDRRIPPRVIKGKPVHEPAS